MPGKKKFYNPSEAVTYLNERLHPDPPLNLARLGRLRRDGRIRGEKLGERDTVYTAATLEKVTLEDIQDKRRSVSKTY